MKPAKQMSLLIESGAEFSLDRIYRYSLWRFWNKSKGYVAFVCLNPSTADESENDPTVTRCINFANSWGYGGMIMLNLFAYRSKNPKKLSGIKNLIGPDNDFHIRNASSKAGITVVAWGIDKSIGNRAREVLNIIQNPHCLALTKNGSPWHPLYLRKDLRPVPFKIKN